MRGSSSARGTGVPFQLGLRQLASNRPTRLADGRERESAPIRNSETKPRKPNAFANPLAVSRSESSSERETASIGLLFWFPRSRALRSGIRLHKGEIIACLECFASY
jgi:hypothetical protein